jgi:hypothetical protein
MREKTWIEDYDNLDKRYKISRDELRNINN